MRSFRSRTGTVRARTTAGAVLVVGLGLAIAAVSLVVLLRRSLTEDVRATAHLRAQAVAAELTQGEVLEELPSSGDEDFVQVLDPRGTVVASTTNLRGASPVVRLEAGATRKVQVPFDDDPFLAVALALQTQQGALTVVSGHTLDSVIESSAALIRLLLLGIPILLIFVAAVTWWVVGRALKPVESIRSKVETLSGQDLHRRVPVPGTSDEIARLAGTMNQMLERLQRSQLRQRRFVSDASHELRSPLATIRQHAEIAQAQPGQTSPSDLAELVLAEALRLQRLVDDLLLLARLDEGTDRMTKKAVDFDDIVLAESERLRKLDGKAMDTSRVSAGRVLGDPRQLSRLVANLLENAARHARRASAVALFERDGEVVLQVDDDGLGIPAADHRKVFERFVRLEEARDRDSGGSGLGLAIVAEVARDHGGGATVADSPLGGARFEIRLPRLSD